MRPTFVTMDFSTNVYLANTANHQEAREIGGVDDALGDTTRRTTPTFDGIVGVLCCASILQLLRRAARYYAMMQ